LELMNFGVLEYFKYQEWYFYLLIQLAF
jgi:hypothetical protein